MLFNRLFKKDSVPKVSVVVPIYNVEQYLDECLESLVNQSLKDIEIICVNDGSTDGSLDIIRKFEVKDERIVVIDKPNSGYGHTMNTGFKKARGEYIGITESDDIASADMFKTLYKFAKKYNCDLVKSNYFEHSDEGDTFEEPFAGLPYYKVFDPRKDQRALGALPIIWAGLYRRSMLIENKVAFNETPGASYQDTSFVFQVWACARRVMLLREGFLRYRVDNENSSVKSSAKVFEVCGEYALSEAFLRQDKERFDAFAQTLNFLKLGTYRWNFNRLADDSRKDFSKKMEQEYRAAYDAGLLKKELFPEEDWDLLMLLINDYDAFMERCAVSMPFPWESDTTD